MTTAVIKYPNISPSFGYLNSVIFIAFFHLLKEPVTSPVPLLCLSILKQTPCFHWYGLISLPSSDIFFLRQTLVSIFLIYEVRSHYPRAFTFRSHNHCILYSPKKWTDHCLLGKCFHHEKRPLAVLSKTSFDGQCRSLCRLCLVLTVGALFSLRKPFSTKIFFHDCTTSSCL